jgi:hypothetical protein
MRIIGRNGEGVIDTEGRSYATAGRQSARDLEGFNEESRRVFLLLRKRKGKFSDLKNYGESVYLFNNNRAKS